jgi:DNA polymerase III epsilon subunit-like protein
MCVIDVETTGTEHNYHEIVQLCLVPIDHKFEIRKDATPFYINIKPNYPKRIDPQAMRVNGLSLKDLNARGHDPEMALGMLERWYKKLVPLNKGGEYHAKIIPVGHNYAQFDKMMIENWMCDNGMEYNDIFHWHPRDTQVMACLMNDRYAMRGQTPPFREVNLNYLCNKFGFENHHAHDALGDCQVTAQIFKALCTYKESQFEVF